MIDPADTFFGKRDVGRVFAPCTHAGNTGTRRLRGSVAGSKCGDEARRRAVSTAASAAAPVACTQRRGGRSLA
jgi:hypothetical protein